MYTLDNFYQSKEWVKLTHVLRLERLNDDGELICQFCGKPITNKYDAIAHHMTYLTNANVNDADVSLNPSNVQFVHHRCHNLIHEKFGYIRRETFLVYGSPVAGVRSYVDSVATCGDFIIDINSIWSCVTADGEIKKPPVLNSIVFGARDYLIDCVRVRRGKWNNAYICGGYPLIGERERLCKQLGAREVFIESTLEEDLQKVCLIDDKVTRENMELWVLDWWNKFKPSAF